MGIKKDINRPIWLKKLESNQKTCRHISNISHYPSGKFHIGHQCNSSFICRTQWHHRYSTVAGIQQYREVFEKQTDNLLEPGCQTLKRNESVLILSQTQWASLDKTWRTQTQSSYFFNNFDFFSLPKLVICKYAIITPVLTPVSSSKRS